MTHHSPNTSNNLARPDGRERIIHAATRLFAERGFFGVSMSDVADTAGVVKSAIYHHFDSKETLYSAVLGQAIRRGREEMEAAAQGATWRERLDGAIRVLAHLVGPQNHILNLILNGLTQAQVRDRPGSPDQIPPLRREFVSILSREIDNGIRAGDLRPVHTELAAVCLVGLIASSIQSLVDLPEAERVRFATELFLQGVRARARS